MEQEIRYTRHRRRAVVTTTPAVPPPPPDVDSSTEDHLLTLSEPTGWLVKLVASQIELISSSLLSLSYPFAALLSQSHAAPSRVAHGGGSALRRLALGILGAIYACATLLSIMVIAVLIGVALVRFWVEDPVSLRHPLHFDYTHAHPTATVSFAGTKGTRIPTGHAVCVSVMLLMPESDYNRRMGVFQVTADVISSNEDTIAMSSQPCMLRFRSLPIRLMRTYFMGVPLLVGMCSESQKIVVEILKYKEPKQKTEMIRVSLKPRAGTYDLPQIYAAELILNSQLPRRKELVYNWKWTFYVWVSLYVYIMLLIVLVCCFKPFALPGRRADRQQPDQVGKDLRYGLREREGEISDEFYDALRRWRDQARSKRRVTSSLMRPPEPSERNASSQVAGESSEVIDDYGDFAPSESSECVGG